MKKIIYLAALALLSFSCGHENVPDEKRIVRFDVLGITTEQMAPSRVNDPTYDLPSAKVTELWVYEGEQLLCHQVAADPKFGNPSIELTIGQHRLNFVASSQTGQSFSAGAWSADGAANTYGSSGTLTVSATTGAQSVVLERLCYGIKWSSEDYLPAEVKKLRVSINEHTSSLTAGMRGGTTAAKDWEYDVTGRDGAPISVTVYGFPAVKGAEENITTTISFLDASDEVLFTYTRTVPVKTNRRTVISGDMFYGTASTALRVNTDWSDDYETNL